jgi:hypothetical protein
MTTVPAPVTFPAPFAGAERQSWRAIAESLGRNALAGFPARAFEEMAVARSFVGRQQIILSDPAGIRHILIENADNYRRTASVFRLLGPILGPWRTGADFRRGRAARSWPGGCGRRIAAPRLHPSGGRRGAAPLPARLLDRASGARAR